LCLTPPLQPHHWGLTLGVHCLQNGLPLDTDVYDLAAWSSVVELSDRSVRGGSVPVRFPDFTQGGWETAKPFTVDGIDLAKMGIA